MGPVIILIKALFLTTVLTGYHAKQREHGPVQAAQNSTGTPQPLSDEDFTSIEDFSLAHPSTNFPKSFTNLIINTKEGGITTISWSSIKMNMSVYVYIYLKYNQISTYNRHLLILKLQVSQGQNEINYTFEYNATYVIVLIRKLTIGKDVFINKIDQTFNHEKGNKLVLTVKNNCLKGYLSWPVITRAKLYEVRIWHYTSRGEFKLDIQEELSSSQTNYSYEVKGVFQYYAKVICHSVNPYDTIELTAKIPTKEDKCATFKSIFVGGNYSLVLYCSIIQEETGCSRRLTLNYDSPEQNYLLDYDNDEKCFVNITKNYDIASVKFDKVMLNEECIDLEKSLKINASIVSKALHKMILQTK